MLYVPARRKGSFSCISNAEATGICFRGLEEVDAGLVMLQLQMKNLTPLILFPLSSEGGSEPIDFPSLSGYQIVLVNSLHL